MSDTQYVKGFSLSEFIFNGNKVFDPFRFDFDFSIYPPLENPIIVDELMIEKPWIIGHLAYNQPRLWWFVLLYNDIKNPFDELRPSQKLYYPDISVFFTFREHYFNG